MTAEIKNYLDGMMAFGKLSMKDQVWVFMNRPEFVPTGAMLFFMGQ